MFQPSAGSSDLQAAEPGCWRLFAKATKAVKAGPEPQSTGSAGSTQQTIPGTGVSSAMGPLRPRGSVKEALEQKASFGENAAEERCRILELKVKALQGRLRAAEAREESDSRLG